MKSDKSNDYKVIRQMVELFDGMEAAGYSPALRKRLSQRKVLKRIKPFLEGGADVVLRNHVIDLDSEPFVPADCKVEQHKLGGQFEFDSTKIKFYFSKQQKIVWNGRIDGNELRNELEGKSVLNANVLDYLMRHKEIIPDFWKGMRIFFWGTLYVRLDDRVCVRCLQWDNGDWYWKCILLTDGLFDSNCPAAVLAA